MAAIATKFLKEGLLLRLKIRPCWAVGPRERRRSSRWEGRTEWDWKEKKQLKMTQKPETKSEKSVFYRRLGCVPCFSNMKFLNLLKDMATFGQRCLGNYFLFEEKSMKSGKKRCCGAFLLSLAVILRHPNLPTQRQTNSEALSNLHDVEGHWFALAPRVHSPWTWLRSWRGHGLFINGTCLSSSQIFEGLVCTGGWTAYTQTCIVAACLH